MNQFIENSDTAFPPEANVLMMRSGGYADAIGIYIMIRMTLNRNSTFSTKYYKK